MKFSKLTLLAVAPWLLTTSVTKAVVVVADFNDQTAGTLNGKAGGTGLSGTWNGSNAFSTIGGNLTSTNYNLPQSGTAISIRGSNPDAIRQSFRTVTTSPTGEVWFSFLARTNTINASTDSAGISLNTPSTATLFNDRGNFYVQLTGNDLSYSFGTGTAGIVTGVTPTNSVTLIVGRLVINGGGAADTVSIWVNPALTTNPDINSFTPRYSNSSVNALDSITTLGAIGYRAGGETTGGQLDNIRFSDGGGDAAQAFRDVTGVPEPSALALISFATGAAMIRRKRRQA